MKLGFPLEVVRKYPKNKPFVYSVNVNPIGNNLTRKQKEELKAKLEAQLEDSINPHFKQKIFWQVLKNPAVFDTTAVNISTHSMRQLLLTSGYLRAPTPTWDTVIKKDGDIWRTYLTINAPVQQLFHVDSLWYSIKNQELQRLTDSTKIDSTKKHRTDSAIVDVYTPLQRLADTSKTQSFLYKGMTFSQDTITMELDRLVELYRNNGYLKFTRQGLIAIWDTLNPALLRPTTNPVDQMHLLNELEKQRLDPKATLEISRRPGYDTANLVKYYVGKITIIPDYGPEWDSASAKTVVLDSTDIVRYNKRLFKPKIFPENIYLSRGEVYSQKNYLQTITRFNSLIAWRLVNMEPKPREGTDTVDFDLKLMPSKKYLGNANFEVSRNQSFASGNLFGIGVNTNLQNRNFARSADQENISARYGTELGTTDSSGRPIVQSRQFSVGYNIVFPRFIFPGKPIRTVTRGLKGDIRTTLAINYANTQRIDLYKIRSLNTSWGYDGVTESGYYVALKFPNIEYSRLDTLPGLKRIFDSFPTLRNVFSAGLITGGLVSATRNWSLWKKSIITAKANIEYSGFPAISDFIRKNIYDYIKTDFDLKYTQKVGNNETVLRGFLGTGFTRTVNYKGATRSKYLPFFKAYFAGGPNSMRGWGIRRLGPGHSMVYLKGLPDRFGDMQFEANAEQRFYLFKLFGLNFKSAVFADVGNVWFLRKNPDFPGGEFQFKNFLNDLAVDMGTGVRLDLGFFLVRLDYAWKVRNPSPEPVNSAAQYKWFYHIKPFNGTLQFAVTYPF